jgi:hypothetical protein
MIHYLTKFPLDFDCRFSNLLDFTFFFWFYRNSFFHFIDMFITFFSVVEIFSSKFLYNLIVLSHL